MKRISDRQFKIFVVFELAWACLCTKLVSVLPAMRPRAETVDRMFAVSKIGKYADRPVDWFGDIVMYVFGLFWMSATTLLIGLFLVNLLPFLRRWWQRVVRPLERWPEEGWVYYYTGVMLAGLIGAPVTIRFGIG